MSAFAADTCHGRYRGELIGFGLLAMAGHGRGRHGHGGPPFGRGGFFPGGPGGFGFPRHRRARRGDVRMAALLLLAEEPRNGYQLMQELEERSGGVWRPSPGSVYPALAQLEDEGLVRAEEEHGRRTFVLTDAGRAYVEEHRGDAPAPWEQIGGDVDEDVASLGLEIRKVLMAAGQVGRLGAPAQVAQARAILAEARRALYGLLAEDPPAEGEE